MRKTTIILVVSFVFGAPALAFDIPDTPVTITGEVSPYYILDLTEEQKKIKGYETTITERNYYNRFSVKDAYLGLDIDVTDGVYVSGTVGYEADGNYHITYGYVALTDIIPRHNLYVGLIKAPWVYYEDEIWGWRTVKNVGVEWYGFLSGGELGVGIDGAVFGPYIEHYFAFANGDSVPGSNYRGKAVEYRLSLFPLAGIEFFKGFSINGLLHCGNLFGDDITYYYYYTDEDLTFGPFRADTYGAFVGFDHRYMTLGAGYFERAEGDVFQADHQKPYYSRDVISYLWTGYATFHFSPRFHALGRFDFLEPDTGSRDDWRTEHYDESYDKYVNLIVGAGFEFYDGHFKVVPNYQTSIPEREVNIGDDPDHEYHSVFVTTEHYFYVNMQAKF
jgi:hypothetical protein